MSGPTDRPPPPGPDAPEDHGLPALTPDIIEQEAGSKLDNIVPTQGFAKLPVVGLGGSAGGLAALQAFFGAMPAASGMAFVVIMHLSPEHESILAEVLQRATPMPVRQVYDRVKVEADHVYVIPPAKHLSMADGHLVLSEVARARPGKHVAVDLFFRTLADTHGPRSAAVVFSGADGDGATGIKRIKERGGLTVAQDPTEAEHSSMPRATIATGMVDWVLPAAEIPARLVEYWRTETRLRLPAEEGLPPAREGAVPDPERTTSTTETAIHGILGFLRAHTGRDFSYYKRATILRRIARRMQVNAIEEPGRYLTFLRTHPGETGALLQDLLISVTNFFRDREAFAALEAMIPALFYGKGTADTVRVWSAACATGEEAFSVAMLLHEHAATLDHPPSIQVFATDLDENAIQQARDGAYLETISADVSEERLRRYFTRGHGHYRVKREIRETVLFALHDVLKDSPFSRLDLVTCRNLLIYLTREAQERALGVFHFALHPEGVLFLGSSESVDEDSALFAATDKKYRLYARRAVVRPRLPPVFAGPTAQTRSLLRHQHEGPVLPRTLPAAPPAAPERTQAPGGDPVAWAEVHARAIENFGPPSVIVNQEHSLVHLSGNAGRYLQFSNGEPTTNLLRVVHPMLRIELRAALFRAAQSGDVTETRGVPIEIEGQRRLIDLRVAPTLQQAPGFLLVIFVEREGTAAAPPNRTVGGDDAQPAVRELERELEQLKATLRDTVEQSDASQEELKASNEELQAMNEELRSTSEELETGREELQSINEELSTVNQEMKGKVEELGRSNSDLQNLMAATQIATVFLDRELDIQRYTPPAVALFNLIPTDVGRPLSDLTPRFHYPNLTADAGRVLENLAVVEREVAHPDGRYFLARLRPYRTDSNRIAGVVLTFVDITDRKRNEAALAESMRQLEEQTRLFDTTLSGIADFAYIFDRTGRFRLANRALADLLELTPERIVGKTFHELPYPAELAEKLQRQVQQVFDTGETLTDEMPFTSPTGLSAVYEYILRPVSSADGRSVEFVAGSTRDITARKRAEAAQMNFRQIFESAPGNYAVLEPDTFKVVAVSDAYLQATMTTRAGFVNRTFFEVAPDHGAAQTEAARLLRASFARVKATGHADAMAVLYYPLARPESGTGERWWSPVNSPIYGVGGELAYLIHRVEDVTLFIQNQRAEGRETEAFVQIEDRARQMEIDIVLRAQELQRANDQLRDAEKCLRMAMAAGRLFSWEINTRTRRFEWWANVENVVGFRPPDSLDAFFEIVHPDDRAAKRDAMNAALETGGDFEAEFRLVHPATGELIWFHSQGSVASHLSDEVPRFVGITENITERKRYDDERARLLASTQAARAEAERANHAKDRFLAVLSHELRAPLAPVQMALFALERETRLSARGRESVRMIARNVESETRLIDDLLDVSRIVHGKFELMHVPVDLHECIRRAIEVCEGDLTAKNLRLNLSLAATRVHLTGDTQRLQQVFWNLCKNAAKFTPPGGAVTLRSVDGHLDDGTGCISVEITDTGIGIPPEILPKLFDAFEQGGPEVVRLYGGLGLGLAISNAIVQAHGGQLRVESAGRDQGSTFTVRFAATVEPGESLPTT